MGDVNLRAAPPAMSLGAPAIDSGRSAAGFRGPPVREGSAPRQWTRTHSLLLGVILAVGIALRVHGVIAFPFDQDELYTLLESRDLFATTLQPGIEARPLYYLLQHPFLGLSQSEVGLRVIPAIFGVLGLAATALAAVRLVGPIGALAATALAVVSPWHLYVSTTARYFSLVYLLTALLVWRLPFALDRERRTDLLAVLGILVVGTATHPAFEITAVWVVLAMMLVGADGSVGWRWPSRRAWRWLWGPFGLLVAAAVAALALTGNEAAVRNWNGRGFAATLRLVPAVLEWQTLPVAAIGAAGAILLMRLRKPTRRVGVMALLVPVGTLALMCVMSLRTDIYADYAVGTLPVAFVAAGGAVQWLSDRAGKWRLHAASLLVGVTIAGGFPSTMSFLLDGARFDYRPAFARVQREAPHETVFVWPVVIQRRYAPALRGQELYSSAATRDSILTAAGRAWAVISVKRQGIAADDDGSIARWLAARCRFVDRFERPRFDYRLYQVELWRCEAPPTRSVPADG